MVLNEILNSQNLKSLCNIIFEESTIHLERKYQKKNIVFCKSNFVPMFFNEISNLDTQVILITHDSDYEVNYNKPQITYKKIFIDGEVKEVKHLDIGVGFTETAALYRLKPRQVKKWFAINVNHKVSDLIPLPLGLQCHEGTNKTETFDSEYFKNLPELTTSYLNSKTNKRTDLIYCNFSGTHPERPVLINFLNENKLGYIEKEKLNHADYLRKMDQFLFVACPRGNGIDSFRIWEALYHGSIPIVKKHTTHQNLNLPIWQVESWRETLDLSKRNYWIDKHKSGELFQDVSQLYITYWRDLISAEYDKIIVD